MAGTLAHGDPQYDPELLAEGDRRNVVDRYRYWRLEAIVADLDTRRHDFHVAIENWQHDFNIGTVVRTANAFLAAEVHIVGNRRWNRRGAMVTDRYQHVRHHPTVDGAGRGPARPRGEPCSASTTCPAREPIETLALPRDCVPALRPGGSGALRRRRATACDGTFSIAQFGSTRSINAGGGRDRHAHLDPPARRPRARGVLVGLRSGGERTRLSSR